MNQWRQTIRDSALYSCSDCVLYINNQTNTCVTVNSIRAALKETVRYITALCALY